MSLRDAEAFVSSLVVDDSILADDSSCEPATASMALAPLEELPEPNRRTLSATCLSVWFHVLLLAAFAAIRWSIVAEPPRQALAAIVSADDDVHSVTETEISVADDEEAAASGAESALAVQAEVSHEHTIANVSDLSATSFLQTGTPSDWMTAEVNIVGLGRSKANGSGTGKDGDGKASGGDGNGRGSFFGVDITGDKVVYIIDGSNSMIEAFKSPERTRLGRVKKELAASIRSLADDQEWYVVFFNSDAFPIPAERYLTTEEQERETYLQWVQNFVPGGGTNPIPAIQGTLQKLEPDVVFLLTDGEFPPQVIPIVDELNEAETVIHTIGLGDAASIRSTPSLSTRVLMELAVRNNGEAKFIPDAR